VAYVGHHSFNAELTAGINNVDIGSGFDLSKQDPTTAPSATPGASSLAALFPDLVRSYKGYTGIALRRYDGWRDYHAVQFSINRRFKNGFSFGFNDAITLKDIAKVAPRYDHTATGDLVLRADQSQLQDLLQDQLDPRHLMKATAVWQLPTMQGKTGAMRVVAVIINDWQLSGVWTAATGTPYAVGFNYQNTSAPNVNLTGSPDYGSRIRIVSPVAGQGCSSNQFSQFSASAFQGPLVGQSVGLESANNYLIGCFSNAIDVSLARNIRVGGGRTIQLRVDAFNAPNQALINGRQNTVTLQNHRYQ
jgi:hypothetical protein